MVTLTLQETQLFRMLASIFGGEQVLPHLSVSLICGGNLPETPMMKNATPSERQAIQGWAKKCKCLFTVVDRFDNPKLVIEFFSGFSHSVDPLEEEHQRLIPPFLDAIGPKH